MLVDDDYTLKLALEAMLTSMGYDVVGQADSGEQAVQMARDLKPDLILMDIVMPGHMDGITAAQEIRSELNVAIVFLTGYGDPEYVERAKQVEPFGYVMKPFTDEEIRASVEIALYKKEMERKLRDSHKELSKLNLKLKTEMVERKKCDQELKESEKEYRFLAENMADLVWTVDRNLRTTYVSLSIEKILGFTPEERKRQSLEEMITPASAQAVQEKLMKEIQRDQEGAVDLDRSITMEVEYYRKDGATVWMENKVKMIRDSKNAFVGIIGVSRDITERKRAEHELQKSRREWERIFQAIGHPTLILDTHHRLIHANAATEKATGKPETDLIGKRCYEIFHNTDGPPEGCPCEKMIASGHLETVEMEMEALGDSFLISCTPMLDSKGQIEKVIHIATDITKQKKAQEELRQSEQKYRDLVENINDVIFALDATGTVTYISSAIEKASGYSPADLIGKNMLEFIHPDDGAVMVERFRKLTMLGVIRPYEYRLIDKSGEIHWIRSSSRPIVQDGKTVGVQGIFTDMTQSKRLEEQLRQTQKMEAIGTLTGGIAHDYNNLLAMIMGNLSLAREETEPHSVMAEFLRQAEQASYKARDLTHQLMTLSQGGYPMKKLGSIEALLKEVPRQVRAHEGIEYFFSIQDDLWPVEYDSRQMHYAINNVLINAVEAMPQGGTVTIQAENKVIENKDKEFPLLLDGGKYVRISIRDEGRGIPEEHLNQVFDPYFSTKERGVQKGMGMGLTTAYAVVQKHGGHIMVNSTTGVGTTVTIYLPAECAESKAPGAKRDDVEAQSTIQKILVMDDEESLRSLAQKMLERLEYKVETVKDGVEAIETYKKHMDSGEPFDGIILDLTIKGGMGGDQAIKELIKIDPDVKAIVCSGYFNDPVLTNYAEHGFRGAMEKPYQKADLESVLKQVLG